MLTGVLKSKLPGLTLQQTMGTNETFMSCRVGDLILRETTTSTTALVQELTAVCVV